ncbi:MAG: hypothetical protein K9H49_03405 [Bacteroidales bacterium]|nr:hypothetical protein [Bacteroidales bacterium]MCF8406208.1 hypothetical protein [Bacteroidales bacterium]
MKKIIKIEFIKTINYGPVKILIPLHILFFFLGFFAIPRIKIDFPFLSVLPLYQFPHVWNFITWVGGFYNLSLVLLIIMLTCLEFTNKTYKHQAIFGLSRRELFLQKVFLAASFAFYVVILTVITVLISGLVYSYKITLSIILDRSWIIFASFLQNFIWLMLGVLFALIFKNMILAVISFGFYRVMLEPIIRSLVEKEHSWYFPTKFVTKLTPEPDILNIVKEKIQAADQVSPDELESIGKTIFPDIPIVQNVVLSLIFLSVILFFSYYIFQKRRLN